MTQNGEPLYGSVGLFNREDPGAVYERHVLQATAFMVEEVMSFFGLSFLPSTQGDLKKKKKKTRSVFNDDAIYSSFAQASGEIWKNVGMFISSGHRTLLKDKNRTGM